MPYITEKKGLRLLPKDDRRRKLDEKDRGHIRWLYKQGEAIREIARRMPFISRRMVQFVLFPEREERQKKLAKARGQSKKNYARERGKKWAARMRELRQRRYKLLKAKALTFNKAQSN